MITGDPVFIRLGRTVQESWGDITTGGSDLLHRKRSPVSNRSEAKEMRKGEILVMAIRGGVNPTETVFAAVAPFPSSMTKFAAQGVGGLAR